MTRGNSGFRRRAMLLGTLAGATALVFATIALATVQPVSDPPGFDRALAAKQANIDGLLAIKGWLAPASGWPPTGPRQSS